MPTKVAFDNNFVDVFIDADAARRAAVFRCVDQGALEMFATYEMLREVMGLALTARKDKIIAFAKDILSLTKGKILATMADAQESELRGAFTLLMEVGASAQIVKFLEQAASGHIPSAAASIGQAALDQKNNAKTQTDAWYASIVNSANALTSAQRKAANYQSIQQRHWANTEHATVVELCQRDGIPDPTGVADRVMADPDKYPHTQFQQRIFAVMMHRYFIDGVRQDATDLYDLWQMIYLVDMDVFLTNEKRLPGWYADVYGPSKRVMTAKEFLDNTWC